MVYRFIDDNKNIFGLRWLCKKFGISPNCYYNYKKDCRTKDYFNNRKGILKGVI